MTSPTSEPRLTLEWIDDRLAICRLGSEDHVPRWALTASGFTSVSRTGDELSIVVGERNVPLEVTSDRGWVALRVAGRLDFALVGILARLTGALASARVPVFAISTYDTDYLLVKEHDANRAAVALQDVADVNPVPAFQSRS